MVREPKHVAKKNARSPRGESGAEASSPSEVPSPSANLSPGDASSSSVSLSPAEVSPPSSDDKPQKSKRSFLDHVLRWAPLLLVLVGVGVLLYPVVATRHNNAEQQRIAAEYGAIAETTGPDVLAAQLAAAEKYNAGLASMPILDPWIEQQRPDTPEYQEYLSQLTVNPVMSRLTIPGIHVDLPIYHGTENSTLNIGVGHLFGTALPVGGTSTHSVLTAHSGLGTATMFDNLTDVKVGDVFYVETLGRTMKYQVVDIQVVLPNETDSLIKQPGRDLVTLITCTPYAVNTHRLLVTGERVAIDPITAAQQQDAAAPAPMEDWMIMVIVIVCAVLAILALIGLRWAIGAFLRRRKRSGEDEASDAGAVGTDTREVASVVDSSGVAGLDGLADGRVRDSPGAADRGDPADGRVRDSPGAADVT